VTNAREPRPRGYAKPIVVPDRLELLVGPTSGIVQLPRHLDWSGSAEYDLNEPVRVVDYYRAVLIEATKPADLHAFLDLATLRLLWPSLWLPRDLRAAWELRFPSLRSAGQRNTAA
jgi:hypothetical protein